MYSLNDLAYKIWACFQTFRIVSTWPEFCALSDQDPNDPDFTAEQLAFLIFHYQLSHGTAQAGYFNFGQEMRKYEAMLDMMTSDQ